MRKLLWIFPFLILIAFFPLIAPNSLLRVIFNPIFSVKLHAKASIQTIHLSWLGPQKFQQISLSTPDMSGYIGELALSTPLWNLNGSGHNLEIKEGSLLFSSQPDFGLNHIRASINDHTFLAQGEALPKGHFSLNGKIYSAKDFDITFDLQEIPTLALDQLLNGKKNLSQILGAVVNATGSWIFNQTKGQLKLDLQSSNVATYFNADIGPEFMTLQEPLRAALAISPELSRALLRNANPLFLTGISAQNPVSLRIEPDGFLYPWHPFIRSKIAIKEGLLDMGKIECQTGEALSKLIALFKNFQRSNTSLIWFSPISFSIEKGVLHTKRMDALISNTIHICTWGDIDLNSNKLDMTLGICADTLQSSFGIRSIPSNYVLKIPLRGTTENPELDTQAATAKIAALAALNQLPNVGGKVGKAFSGALQIAKAAQESQDDVPPPHRPYPWE